MLLLMKLNLDFFFVEGFALLIDALDGAVETVDSASDRVFSSSEASTLPA